MQLSTCEMYKGKKKCHAQNKINKKIRIIPINIYIVSKTRKGREKNENCRGKPKYINMCLRAFRIKYKANNFV